MEREDFLAFVSGLPLDSAYRQLQGVWTRTDANIATLTDFVVDTSITEHQRVTFNPEKFPEHKKIQEQSERNKKLPPALPSVAPVAERPVGVPSLAAQFSELVEPDEPDVQASADINFTDIDDFLAYIALH